MKQSFSKKVMLGKGVEVGSIATFLSILLSVLNRKMNLQFSESEINIMSGILIGVYASVKNWYKQKGIKISEG